MRISDWSSDVCSSDLIGDIERFGDRIADLMIAVLHPDDVDVAAAVDAALRGKRDHAAIDREPQPPALMVDRSEEHTSELQSLMRISYAVFCLKITMIPYTNLLNAIPKTTTSTTTTIFIITPNTIHISKNTCI